MPTMSCTEFSRRLDEAIERRESVDSVGLREHATTCAECRVLWLDALAVDQAIGKWKKPVADAGLVDRILAQLANDTALAEEAVAGDEHVLANPVAAERSPQPPRRINRTAGAAVAAVAVCLLAVLFVSRPRQPVPIAHQEQSRTAEPVLAATTDPKLKPVLPVAVLPAATPALSAPVPASPAPALPMPTESAPVEVMVADAGSAYLHLAGDAAKAVTAASVLVPPADATEEPAAVPKDEEPWVDGMRREIAPVTHQLSHAFEFLIQAVPEKRAPAT